MLTGKDEHDSYANVLNILLYFTVFLYTQRFDYIFNFYLES